MAEVVMRVGLISIRSEDSFMLVRPPSVRTEVQQSKVISSIALVVPLQVGHPGTFSGLNGIVMMEHDAVDLLQ